MNVTILTAAIIFLLNIEVGSEMLMPIFSRRPLSITHVVPASSLALQQHIAALQKCNPNNGITKCHLYPTDFTSSNSMTSIDKTIQSVGDKFMINSNSASERMAEISYGTNFYPSRRMFDPNNNLNRIPLINGKLNAFVTQDNEYPAPVTNKLNMKLDILPTKWTKVPVKTSVDTDINPITISFSKNPNQALESFSQSLDRFERKFFATTFNKLALIAPLSRRENGMSYVQSGLFLQLALMALSMEVGPETKREIDNCLGIHFSDQEIVEVIDATVSSLPILSDDLKFRWSSRLVLRSQAVSEQFRAGAASALRLRIDQFNGTESPKEMTDALNHMVEMDTGGAIHNTFEEDELSDDVRAVFLSTLYLRARWRSAPTLLNGSRPFRDSEGAPHRAARMIRVNDVMMYADLSHWDAEALEIPYSTPGLTLVMLVPRGNSLRRLVAAAVNTSVGDITAMMRPLRVAATLPLYTLRMTLLLPNKLQAMNISRLVDAEGSPGEFRLSLAVQRIMFWAEAGRNAFKDDGLEWDVAPQKEIIVDRPYIFYVRWKNKTIMNGNFVL